MKGIVRGLRKMLNDEDEVIGYDELAGAAVMFFIAMAFGLGGIVFSMLLVLV